MRQAATQEIARWHDLDAVRGGALLLGVVLHGVMSFMTPRIWIVGDSAPDPAFNVVFYAIHLFRMTTFFLLAGFFARLLLERRGLRDFVVNRLKRIALPFAVFWPIVVPAIIGLAILANLPAPGETAPPAPPPPPGVPLAHLWFLYVLLLLYAGALAVRAIARRIPGSETFGRQLDGVVRGLVRADLMPLVLGLPLATAFFYRDNWLLWFGVPTPDIGVVPNLAAVTAFTTAFAFGWWLHRSAELIDHLAKRVWFYGPAALAGTWACLKLAGVTPTLVPVSGDANPFYCLAYPITAWIWSFFLVGAARRFLHAANPVVTYLAEASYWVYLIHVPVLLFFQHLVQDLAAPSLAKVIVVIGGTLFVSLLSYQLLVRYSFMGAILNGRRRKAKPAPTMQEARA